MSDVRTPSASFRPALDTLQPGNFDASIFDRVALPPDADAVDADEPDEDDEPAPQREGLPPGFRMRHDAHYVEELVSRNRASHVGPVPAPEASQPRNGHRAAEEAPGLSTADACVEIGQSLDAIGACLGLLPPSGRTAPERAALELIASEVSRAAWFVQALSLLEREVPVANTVVELAPVVRKAVRGVTPRWERTAVTVTVDGSPHDTSVRGDEGLLVLALAGMVMAVQAVTERVDSAAVAIRLRRDDGRAIVEVAQDAVRLPAAWLAKFLDAEWPERPGGRRVGVSLAASQRVAQLHRGALTVGETEQGGCRLALALPGTALPPQ